MLNLYEKHLPSREVNVIMKIGTQYIFNVDNNWKTKCLVNAVGFEAFVVMISKEDLLACFVLTAIRYGSGT